MNSKMNSKWLFGLLFTFILSLMALLFMPVSQPTSLANTPQQALKSQHQTTDVADKAPGDFVSLKKSAPGVDKSMDSPYEENIQSKRRFSTALTQQSLATQDTASNAFGTDQDADDPVNVAAMDAANSDTRQNGSNTVNTAPLGSTDTENASAIVAEALKYLGQKNTNGKFDGGNTDASGWCHQFVNYVIKNVTGQEAPWGADGGPKEIYDWAEQNGRLVDKAAVKAGDLIVTDLDKGFVQMHVAIVEKVDQDGTVHRINGNWGSDNIEDSIVEKDSISIDDASIDGFIRLN